jgi:two-component system, chemotaxis family, protein-glutamate methylesterase/glutaminase
MATRLKVLIVDDSALMRQLLTSILASDPEIEVVGTAADPYDAREKIKSLNPDVLTLDIEMPRMDGLTFLQKLMRGHPMPVIMISSFTSSGASTTLRALSLGAIDYVSKPRVNMTSGAIEQAEEIVAIVKAAAKAGVRHAPASRKMHAPLMKKTYRSSGTSKVVAIGASTGGTEAIKELLTPLPADFPGIVMVQHMPEAFTRQFAARLDSLCKIRVKEAKDGDRVLNGHALLAPGGHHMAVERRGMEYAVHVYRGERVNRHLPSVDVLFSSCARSVGENALGVLLTGMGADGAMGMLEMKRAGAFNIAQDESTSVVFGMPREALLLNAVDQVLPLGQIPIALLERLASFSRKYRPPQK